MMNNEESIVPMVSARRIYGVDEYVRTDGRILWCIIVCHILSALSLQPLKQMKIIDFLIMMLFL